MSERVCLAKIATAHGIRGMVKLIVHADDPGNLEIHGPLYTSETGEETLTVKLHNPMGKYHLAEIEGIADRTAAEKLRGTELWLPRDKLPAAGKGQHYYADLIGLPARDGQGNGLGKIIAVANFGASDLLEIQPPGAPSFYLPFTKDYVLEINDDCAVVFIPAGLV